MPLAASIARARGIIRKSPGYILRRTLQETEREFDRWLAPRRQRQFDNGHLLRLAGASIDELWARLRARAGEYGAAICNVS